MKRWIAVLALLAVGCSGAENSKLGDRDDLTKSDARSMGGVDEDGEDLCELFGWYDDDVCDDFCVDADPDCDRGNNEPDNNEPDNNEPDNNEPDNNEPDNNEPDNNMSGADCGGIAGLTCADGEFCNYAADAMCGAADQLGMCEPMPEACDLVYDPVCGCDGNDYGNACTANAAGSAVASEGLCNPPVCADNTECARGEVCVNGLCTEDPNVMLCGGIAGLMCPAGQFCNWAIDDMCGAADALGACEVMPEVCPDIYQPVCGCDQMTYSNECDANAAGVSVVARGECGLACQANTDCPENELCINGTCQNLGQGQCGGFAGYVCGRDEWCDYPPNSMCGATDSIGECKTRPEVCLAVFDPVCGCDDVTYSNECVANAAGVDIASQGACPL